MLAELPYEDRFMLYGAWRGHGMEKHALGVKHMQFAVAEVRSVHELPLPLRFGDGVVPANVTI